MRSKQGDKITGALFELPVRRLIWPVAVVIFLSIILQVTGCTSVGPAQPEERLAEAAVTERALDDVDRLPEPLVPTSVPEVIDTLALRDVLFKISSTPSTERTYDELDAWLDGYPESAWRLSVLLNHGLVLYHSGYFSRAIKAYEEAWAVGKSFSEPAAKAIADRALGELARMHARLGHKEALRELFDEVKDRDVIGAASELVLSSKESLTLMIEEPEVSFMCGPFALRAIAARTNVPPESRSKLSELVSGPNGTTLYQLNEAAREAGMGYQAVYREAGSDLPLPALVHWKVNHFAAVTEFVDGRYRVPDPTFRKDVWVTPEALNREASGYFMIPEADVRGNWRVASAEESRTIFGMGYTGGKEEERTTPEDDKEECCEQPDANPGMATYAIHTMLVSLNITDTPLAYTPPYGPAMNFTLTYNQREIGRDASMDYSNFGPKWTFNWLSFIEDDPNNLNAEVKHYVSGGGWRNYDAMGTAQNGGRFFPSGQTKSWLERDAASQSIRYVLHHADGSKDVFEESDGADPIRKVFMTERHDRFGNIVKVHYTAGQKISTIEDALGQHSSIVHKSGTNLVESITDPFGRTATFVYDGIGRLKSIEDALNSTSQGSGLISEFDYLDDTDRVTRLTTPYKQATVRHTLFEYCDAVEDTECRDTTNDSALTWRRITVTDPEGEKERVEFRHKAPGIVSSVGSSSLDYPPTEMVGGLATDGLLWFRNTFVWDKQNAKVNGITDYTKSHRIHWLHANDPNTVTGVKESEKRPGENRIWYAYAAQRQLADERHAPDHDPIFAGMQDQPSVVGRRRPDGTSQIWYSYYNEAGKPVRTIDPKGRELALHYASNNIDLLEVKRPDGGTDVLPTEGFDTSPLGQPEWVVEDQYGSVAVTGSRLRVEADPVHAINLNFAWERDLGVMACRRVEETDFVAEVTVTSLNLKDNARVFMLRHSTNALSPNVQIVINRINNQRIRLVERGVPGRLTYDLPVSSTINYVPTEPIDVRFEYDGWKVTAKVRQGGGSYQTLGEVVFGGLNWVCLPDNHIVDSHGTGAPQEFDDFKLTIPSYEDPLAVYTYYPNHLVQTYTDAEGNPTSYTYTSQGQLKTVSNALSQTTEWFYDTNGYLDYIENELDERVAEFDYDAKGRIDSVTDGAGREVGYLYDDLNRLRKITYADTTEEIFEYDNADLESYEDRLERITTYAYNALGQLEGVTDALMASSVIEPCVGCGGIGNLLDPISHETDWVRNGANRVTQETSLDRGTIGSTYDINGYLRTTTDARNITATFSYNKAGELNGVSYPDTSENITYTYDAYAGCTNGIGRVCRIADPAGETVFDYYRDGLVKSETRTEAGQSYSTSYEYNAARQLTKVTTPTGQVIEITPDAVGRMGSLSTAINGSPIDVLSSVQYNPVNQLLTQTFGNGLKEGRVYDDDNRLDKIIVVDANDPDPDSDGDGIPDSWELAHGLDPYDALDAALDPDGDGLTNLQEYQAGTDPNNADTDGDSIGDATDPMPLFNPAWLAPIKELLL